MRELSAEEKQLAEALGYNPNILYPYQLAAIARIRLEVAGKEARQSESDKAELLEALKEAHRISGIFESDEDDWGEMLDNIYQLTTEALNKHRS